MRREPDTALRKAAPIRRKPANPSNGRDGPGAPALVHPEQPASRPGPRETDRTPRYGRSRPEPDPIFPLVNRLARDLDRMCREAVDPDELAAHLEARGYSAYRVRQEFGLGNTLELAARLFELTPRRPVQREPALHSWGRTSPAALPDKPTWMGRIAFFLAYVAALKLVSQAGQAGWGSILWLLAWPQVGLALFYRARSELDEAQAQGILLLLLAPVGIVVGLMGVLLLHSVVLWAAGALWGAVAGFIWSGKPRHALAVAVTVGAAAWTGLSAGWIFVVALAVFIFLAWRLWTVPSGEALVWMARRWKEVAPYGLAGLGYGLLLLDLFGRASSVSLPGAVLFVFVILASEFHIARFELQLVRLLWRESDEDRFIRQAGVHLLAYGAANLLPFLAALSLPLVWGRDAPWLVPLLGFAFLGFVLSLGLAQMSLGGIAPTAGAFLLGGGLAFLGLPFMIASALTAGVLGLTLFFRLRWVATYALLLL